MSKIAVLLVEDESMIRLDVQVGLEDAGFEVAAARDAAEAMTIFDAQASSIGALITDIRLGNGATGWEVGRHCRATNPALPVIYMSGDSSGDWRSQGVPKSCMIAKPFVIAQIITALSNLLNAVAETPTDLPRTAE